MADHTPDNSELAVDELKRKARRRLVGAVVLALAAAVVLPMLLEKDPKPLGEDVSVKIPPIDDGRFVSQLSSGKGAESAPPTTKAAPAGPAASSAPAPTKPDAAVAAVVEAKPTSAGAAVPAPRKTIAEAEQRMLAPASKPVTAPLPVAEPPPATTTVATTGETPAAALPAAKPESRGAAAPAPPAAKVETAPAPPATAPVREGFVVQLAAFADDKGANALAGKLKKVGYAAYVEPVQTSRGTLWRVRVGGYGSRADADAARGKLKAEGQNGIVVPAS